MPSEPESVKTHKIDPPNQPYGPEAAEHVAFARRLSVKLEELSFGKKGKKKIDGMPVHMADMYEICFKYCRAIDRFLSLPIEGNSEAILESFDDIRGQLRDHLPNHRKPLLKGIRVLEEMVEPDPDLRDDHQRQRLAAAYKKLGIEIPGWKEAMEAGSEVQRRANRKKRK